MLNLNKPLEEKSLDDPWKVLIYDSFCRDIISPLLKVGELRKQGVTLHMYADSLHVEFLALLCVILFHGICSIC